MRGLRLADVDGEEGKTQPDHMIQIAELDTHNFRKLRKPQQSNASRSDCYGA
jgi:hypothetical protein